MKEHNKTTESWQIPKEIDKDIQVVHNRNGDDKQGAEKHQQGETKVDNMTADPCNAIRAPH